MNSKKAKGLRKLAARLWGMLPESKKVPFLRIDRHDGHSAMRIYPAARFYRRLKKQYTRGYPMVIENPWKGEGAK